MHNTPCVSAPMQATETISCEIDLIYIIDALEEINFRKVKIALLKTATFQPSFYFFFLWSSFK